MTQEDTSTPSQYALLLNPFAVLVLMIKNAYSLSDSCLQMLLLTMAMLIKIVGVAFIAPTFNHSLMSFP